MTSTNWPVFSPFAREHYGRGFEEGRAEGKAEAKAEAEAEGRTAGKAEGAARSVLLVLAARGFDVPQDTQDTIISCTDPGQLETWVTRATTAQTLHEIFD